MPIPPYTAMMNPLLAAIRLIGGSGNNREIDEKVIEIENYPEEDQLIIHNANRGNQTEISYRLAWAKTYLKKFGLLENSVHGVWALTEMANGYETVVPAEVVAHVRLMDANNRINNNINNDDNIIQGADVDIQNAPQIADWKAKLHEILTQSLSPSGFERLVQRLLRESGFTQVEVTGQTGDGGIDGKGIARIHGFMSFHVLFQCKRYTGVVGSPEIRNFRGALVGRADKGLFITTGTFSNAAIREATRDGATPIDLVDGDELAEKLKEFNLGIKVELIESISIHEDWYRSI